MACAAPKAVPGTQGAPSAQSARNTPNAIVTHSAALAPSASAGVVAKPPEPLRLSFEMERGASFSTLWLVAPGRPKTRLREVPEPFTCNITEKTRQPRDGCTWSIGCKPNDSPICLRRRGAELELRVFAEQPQDGQLATVPLAPGRRLDVDTKIRGSANEACPVDAPPVLVDAKLVRQNLPDAERATWFEVPSVGLRLGALSLLTPTACDSERVRNRLRFYCMTSESSSTFTASVSDGVLSMAFSSISYDGDLQRSLGAVKLPCGAQLQWPRLRVRDRAWSAVGVGQCGQACRERHTDCEDRCRTQHPASYHDDGKPALDEGEDCLAECQLTLNACPCGQFQ